MMQRSLLRGCGTSIACVYLYSKAKEMHSILHQIEQGIKDVWNMCSNINAL